jgi:hypothetical protein
MAATMKRAFRMLGWKGPFWRHLPKVFQWAGRVGVRQRGLRVHEKNMSELTDVAHRS